MKLPKDTLIENVASYFDIKSRGTFVKWLTAMNKNSAVYYYANGKLEHTRVSKLLEHIGCNWH